MRIIYLTKKQLKKKKKLTGKEKQAKKEYQKNYYQKLTAYKDELLMKKAKKR